MVKCNMFMAECVARIGVNSLLFCTCSNLQFTNMFTISLDASVHNVSIVLNCV